MLAEAQRWAKMERRMVRRMWASSWMLAAVFACRLPAQDTLAVTRISATAGDAVFLVDGQVLEAAAVFTWPAGSKHSLEIAPWQSAPSDSKTRYVFQHWSTPAGALPDPSNSVTITADPGIPWYNADLTTEYDVSINFYQCPDGGCAPPGTIWLNQTAYLQNTDVWLAAGSTVSLDASPNAGYVFAGWGQNGSLAPVYTFVLNGGTTVYPQFSVARVIQLMTVPDGLALLADRATVFSPATVEWGWNTTHTLGAVSPQADKQGRWWMLRSWSDGGAASHTYTVPPGDSVVILTGQFVPAVAVQLLTDPSGLPLTVDGTGSVSPTNLAWAPGDSHTVTAPATATDAQGGPWVFRQWSNGAPNPQTIPVTDAQVAMGIRLTASYDPLSRIRVESVPSGLALAVDGAACHTPCEVSRPVGSTVQLSAPASIGVSDGVRLDFSSWDGAAGPTVTAVAGYHKITAYYQTSYRLALATSPAGAGIWRISPASADGYYIAGSAVSIGIDAASGMKFHGWSQDLSGAANPQSLTMDGPHAVLARFDKLPDTPPPPTIGNAAGDTPVNAVAPGSIASLFGSALADRTATADPAVDPLPQTLAGVTLLCSGHLLPLLYVSPGQINFQVPGDLQPGAYQIALQRAGSPAIQVELTVARNAPGLFVVTHQDGTPVTVDSPAHAGEPLVLYGTGFGPYVPMPMDGFQVPPAPAFPLADPVVVVVEGRNISPDLAAAATGVVGVTVVEFRIPADLDAAAPASVMVQSGGAASNILALPLE